MKSHGHSLFKRPLIVLLILLPNIALAQKLDIGIYYGRFYALYRYKDFGNGFRNQAGSQYNPYPSLVINKSFSERQSVELRASFMSYGQYTGTRLYSPGFYSNYNGGNISLSYNYAFLHSIKMQGRIKGGIGIGIIPDQYEGSFIEILGYPVTDSISRGSIKRNFTPIFLTIVSGFDFSYKISNRLKASIAANYQKGFIKITEYEILYNDGSGKNDQRAKQWGTGDFYGLQLGLRYSLKNKEKKK